VTEKTNPPEVNQEWMVRLTEEREGYEIVAPGGEVMDLVSLVGLEEPFHDVMRKRILRAQRTHRVTRFAEKLRRTE
jgi:hypothetical protein